MRSINYPTYFRTSGYRQVVKMTATGITITEANIVQGSFTFDSRMVEGEAFQVGTAIANEIHVSLDNTTGVYNRSYLGKEFSVSIAAIKTDGTETSSSIASGRWSSLGTYIVTDVDESHSEYCSMVLRDEMVLFDEVIPAFTEDTAYANLSAFCTAVGVPLASGTSTNALKKFNVLTTTNPNNMTYRDFVRGCALLLGANAYIQNSQLAFKTFNTTSVSLSPSDRYNSTLYEIARIGGVQVLDEAGELWSINTNNDDTSRVIIGPNSSVMLSTVGGVRTIARIYEEIYEGQATSYYPPSFSQFGMYYYPMNITAMSWWEIEPGDIITYVRDSTSYTTVVTSVASVLNGRTSITSTADRNDGDVPSETDATRTTTEALQDATDLVSEQAATALDTFHDEYDDFVEGNTEALDQIRSDIDDNYDELSDSIGSLTNATASQIQALRDADETFQSSIDTVDAKYAASFNQLYEYIRFIIDNDVFNGIELGPVPAEGEPRIQLRVGTATIEGVTKNVISFSKDGENLGYWDGSDLYTGNIVVKVTQRAQFGNFAFVPRSDESLSFMKVV